MLYCKLGFKDDVPVGIDKYKITQKNYFCDRDSLDLVNQFLEYFFTAYDTDRKLLAGLYHKNAMFSLTCVYLSGQLSSSTASLKQYSVLSRNLKKAADISKTLQFLYRGSDKIINLFTTKIPFTEHDPYSFTTDLVYKTVSIISPSCSSELTQLTKQGNLRRANDYWSFP